MPARASVAAAPDCPLREADHLSGDPETRYRFMFKPALACTDAQLQLVANRFFALNEPGAASAPIAEALRQDLVTCANEPAHQGSVWPTLPSLRQG